MLPVVAIIRRPNVGKSALFNRLIQRRQALVDATPGLTRDRLYGQVHWRGIPIQVVDTGGLHFAKSDRIGKAIAAQVTKAMEEASLALLVCDGKKGPVPLDEMVASWARTWGKPILLVVNKVDSQKELPAAFEFSSLGVGPPLAVSSLHGLGIGELLDSIVDCLKAAPGTSPVVLAGSSSSQRPETDSRPEEETRPLRIAIVGRPNVGKSSFVNRLLNEERILVDESPGTTRDPVEVHLTYRDRPYTLVDTAGIQSRPKLKSRLDAVARLKALEVIRGADVCLALLEAPLGIVRDDLRILDQVAEAGRPVCLAVNKWDLLKAPPDSESTALGIARKVPFLRFAPVVCISAKTGLHVLEALERATEIADRSNLKISSAQGRQLLEKIQKDPRAPAGVRYSRLLRLVQVSAGPPVFHLYARVQRDLKESDLAYLERVLRRDIGWEGVPIRIRLLAFKRAKKDRR